MSVQGKVGLTFVKGYSILEAVIERSVGIIINQRPNSKSRNYEKEGFTKIAQDRRHIIKKLKPIDQNSRPIVVFFLLILVLIISACNPNAEHKNFTSDPISSVAHGSIIGTDGNIITPNENFILGVQEYYIQTIWKTFNKNYLKTGEEIKRTIYNLVTNKVLANAIFLDWLLEKEQPEKIMHIAVANDALRWYYISNIQKDPILPTGDEPWAKGIETEIAVKFVNAGMDIFIEAPSNAFYMRQCLEAGVPIPDNLFDDTWERLGFFEHSSNRPSELMIYRSSDPAGFCLARNDYVDGISGFYGLICLGTQSSNACFFQDHGITFSGDKNISELGIGISLGCTFCHAGENPFIVHPEDPVFMEAATLKRDFLDPDGIPNLMAADWYKPMFNPRTPRSESFPQNPEPSNISQLEEVPFPDKKCTTCHSKNGGGGRFPRESEFNENYCGNVLYPALMGWGDFSATMPLFDLPNVNKYLNQINKLRRWCGDEPLVGGEPVIGN